MEIYILLEVLLDPTNNNTKFIILTSNTLFAKLVNKLVIPNTRIFTTVSKTDIIRKKNKYITNSNASTYQVNCLQCKRIHIGETSQDLIPL